MLTIEELKKLKKHVDRNGAFGLDQETIDTLYDLIDDKIKRQTTGGWIPVTGPLPKLDCPVLAFDGLRHIAWISSVIGDWTSYEAMHKPTHWMPLPEPPVES